MVFVTTIYLAAIHDEEELISIDDYHSKYMPTIIGGR